MSQFNSPLDQVRVASPCNVDWDQMIGNDRARFCSQCNLNVYNLSNMSRAGAEHLIANNEGRLCVRYYRRTDGSILTQDCPVGLRAIKRRLSYASKAITSTVLGFLAGIGLYGSSMVVESRLRPAHHVMGVLAEKPRGSPPVVMPKSDRVTMGKLLLNPQTQGGNRRRF